MYTYTKKIHLTKEQKKKKKNPSLLFSENILVDGSNIESWFPIGLQPALPVRRAVVFRCILPIVCDKYFWHTYHLR